MSLVMAVDSGQNNRFFVCGGVKGAFYQFLAYLAGSQVCVGIFEHITCVLVPGELIQEMVKDHDVKVSSAMGVEAVKVDKILEVAAYQGVFHLLDVRKNSSTGGDMLTYGHVKRVN